MNRGKSFTRRTRTGKLVFKLSKVHLQIVISIVVSIIMNIPNYFQYDMVPCNKQSMQSCNCSEWNPTDNKFHPFPVWEQLSISRVSMNSSETYEFDGKYQGEKIFEQDEVVYWMHCHSKFSVSLFWNIWFIAYEVNS